MNRLGLCVALVVAIATVSPTATACGENKFRAGHGLKYQSYKAAVPGTVLVLTSARRDMASRALRKAGHRVVQVATAEELQQAMQADRFDVVIVPYAEAPGIVESATSVLTQVVPVVKAHKELHDAQERYGAAIRSVSGGREIIALVNTLISARA